VLENEGRMLSEIELPTLTKNFESMEYQMEHNFGVVVCLKVRFSKSS